MWKVFSLALLAMATASSSTTKDDLLHSPLMTKFRNFNKLGEIRASLEKQCNTYGPQDAFNNLEKSVMNLASGLFATFSSEITKDFSNKEISDYITIACRTITIPSIKDQLETIISSLRQCMNPKHKAYIYSNFKAIEFACSNDGKILTSFIKEGGIECVKNQKSKITKCVEDLFFAQYDNVKDADTLFADPKKVCQSLTMIKKCATEELRHCSSTSAVKLFEGFLNLTNFPTCSHLTEA